MGRQAPVLRSGAPPQSGAAWRLTLSLIALVPAGTGGQRANCFREASSFVRDAIAVPSPAASKEACLSKCRQLAGCRHFSFWGSSRTCWLHGPAAHAQPAALDVSEGSIVDCVDVVVPASATAPPPAPSPLLAPVPPMPAPLVMTPLPPLGPQAGTASTAASTTAASTTQPSPTLPAAAPKLALRAGATQLPSGAAALSSGAGGNLVTSHWALVAAVCVVATLVSGMVSGFCRGEKAKKKRKRSSAQQAEDDTLIANEEAMLGGGAATPPSAPRRGGRPSVTFADPPAHY
mmetsp:Transcript_54390/g.152785  ORF Transcript_54390/g.152785 Transcript_54390/m.152785 type:complete len:290 (+) Transcript_54390:1-870(+)